MQTTGKKKYFKRFALLLSLLALIAWTLLGTGTTLAWFSDTSQEIKNVFHMADFQLDVSYLKHGEWREVDATTKIFNDEALYEPGYVQVVYLRVENNGTVPFDFQAAVSVTDYTPAVNAYGQYFNLQDYLRFGVVSTSTEAKLYALVADRKKAAALADMRLNNYSTEKTALGAGEVAYMALIVRMPEDVDNIANYRGATVPRVEVGVIVNATQLSN